MEDWKVKVSVLWLVWECAAIVTATLKAYTPGFIEEATPEWLLASAIILLIAPVMAFLSLTLKDSTNRWPNIIVGIVFAGLGLGGAIDFLAKPSAYYAFLIPIGIVEVVFAALIVWYAWKSKQKT